MQLIARAFARIAPIPRACPACPPPTPALPCPDTHACACPPACVPLIAMCYRYIGRLFLEGDAATAAVCAPWRAGARPPPIATPYGPCELTDQVPSWRLAEFAGPVGPYLTFTPYVATWRPLVQSRGSHSLCCPQVRADGNVGRRGAGQHVWEGFSIS